MTIRRSYRFLVAIALLASAGGSAGQASDAGAGCGSTWSGAAAAKQCHFQFRGFPLLARGSASATGTASVRVWISLVPGGPPLVECSRSASGSTSCQTGIPDSTTRVQLQPLQTLWCHVQGRGSGAYWCQSAFGI